MMGAPSRLYRNKDWLYKQYWNKNLSVGQIAQASTSYRNTIRMWMKKFDIPRRSLSEAKLLNFPDKPYRDKKVLYKRYWKDGYSISGLSELYSCDRQTVKFWLRRHGIPKRYKAERYELMKKTNKERFYGSTWNRLKLVARDFIGSFKKYF